MLSFPSHYSKNLASWIDCISEIAVPDEGGMARVIEAQPGSIITGSSLQRPKVEGGLARLRDAK